jgi:Carbohydrate-selective porin, OprB family
MYFYYNLSKIRVRTNKMTIDSKFVAANMFFLMLTAPHALANPVDRTINLSGRSKISKDVDNSSILIKDNDLNFQPSLSQLSQSDRYNILTLSKDNSDLNNTKSINREELNNSINSSSDAIPSEWAVRTLNLLAKRYKCTTIHSNNYSVTSQTITRNEFASDLNSCSQRVMELKKNPTTNSVKKEDLLALENLKQEFATELTKLTNNVDNLESRTDIVAKQQISPTTKFGGEVIFLNTYAFGGGQAEGKKPEINPTVAYLARFGLETSFTGKDTLRTYLTTGNFAPGGYANPNAFDTNMARLSSQASLNNQLRLDLLEYRVPAFNDNAVVSIIPVGFQLSSILAPNSGYFDTGRGSISAFAEVNPIFKIGGGSSDNTAGAGIDWAINDKSRLQVAYGAGNTNKTSEGITGSNRSVLGVNLLTSPAKNLVTGITYVNAYTSDGRLGTFTGSINAESSGRFSGGKLPLAGNLIPIGDLAARTQAIGGSLQWQISPKLTFGAWGGWTFTNYLQSFPDYVGGVGEKPYANTQTYLLSLGLSEPFGREGDLLAVLIGMPPKLTAAGPTAPGNSVPFSEISRAGEPGVAITDGIRNLSGAKALAQNDKIFGTPDEATSLHYEIFYRFKVNDNLFITPGFFVVTNPGHISTNNTIFVGTIRTTFRF